ncbi:MAG: hypothetical protein CW338_07955 [Clostridiales bacterium]|nr:hypothetical protein [Clostridiales bacterium]
MNTNRFFAFFSGFPTRHFTDEIAEKLKEEIAIRNSLVFISAWPEDYARNDEDSAGMHGMFSERGMGFRHFAVIDSRTAPTDAAAMIRNADCIFLMGGNATLQMALIREKGLFDELRDCSAVILGVSAGSMNMGKTTVDIWETMEPYEGLGFAGITVKSHYRTEDEHLMKLLHNLSMILPVCAMEDESAIYIKNGQVSCTGRVYRINNGEYTAFSPEMILI